MTFQRHDVFQHERPKNTPTDYTQFAKYARFTGLRLGVPRELFFDVTEVGHQEIIDAVERAILKLDPLAL
jgi:hypothetical protein